MAIFSGRLAQAATYYVSSTGNDARAGTTPATAWRSVARASAQPYGPGDRLLFEGGQTFGGSLWLPGSSRGTPAAPIVISSYGTGAATIASGSSYGFYGYNTAGIELRRLRFVGAGRLSNVSEGVFFYLDAAQTTLRHLRLDSLDVSGYRGAGICIGSSNGTSGYADVRITNSQAHANGEAGISSWADELAAHHDWYVGNCRVYDNAGRADVTNIHTGNGIVLGGIDGALVERCLAYNNGWLSAWPYGGPVGIWGYMCNNLVIQNCESHHNRSGTSADGGGFDLDGGCTNSVLQYNYSHDNQGAGYLLAQYPDAPPMHDLTVRYNVSENDARRHNYGAIHVWSTGASGGIQRAAIHNNTVLLSPPADGSRPKAVNVSSGGFSNLSLRNNVLLTSGGLPVLDTYTAAGLRLEGNCYWSSGAPLALDWAGTRYANLTAWRAATGQERLADGRTTGLAADPQLRPATSPQQTSRLDAEPSSTPAYGPLPASPLRGAGLNLLTEFRLSPGPRDLQGVPTPQAPARGNIGALESQPVAFQPLPVVLSEFSVERWGPAALLRWRTASEQQNAFFAVESSSDGRHFTLLDQVPGHGSSAGPQAYEYADLSLARYASPSVYYRLRQVDTDGRATYSPVRVLTGVAAGSLAPHYLQVAPNPAATGAVVIVRGARGAQVQLLNGRGQLVGGAPVSPDGTAGVPVAGLAAGLYLLRCGPEVVRLVLAD
ncbi:right-handed parallel beta-helix repeat-containing protein [uncultured Hymenobacter sp.]|uniref:right-handed parallel beta-helix repeat-containing protein n=1 Tax=uncultured Hymenobacter sp. TaxID=170016 RepID=UPI0035CA3BF0